MNKIERLLTNPEFHKALNELNIHDKFKSLTPIYEAPSGILGMKEKELNKLLEQTSEFDLTKIQEVLNGLTKEDTVPYISKSQDSWEHKEDGLEENKWYYTSILEDDYVLDILTNINKDVRISILISSGVLYISGLLIYPDEYLEDRIKI